MKKETTGAICLLICAMIWGSAFVAIRLGAQNLPAFTYTAGRLVSGAAALCLFIALMPRYRDRSLYNKDLLRGCLVCGVVYTFAVILQQYGMADTTAGKGGFVAALYILMVPVIEIFLGRKNSPVIWLCILMATVGLFLLCIKPGSFSVGRGELFVLASTLFYSLHILVIDKYVVTCDPLLLSCGQFIFSAAVSVILALLFDKSSLSAVWECRMPVLYAGIMSCAVAHTLQMIGQKTARPTQASLVLSLESVFSAISGYLFLHEILSAREFAGCLIIFGAILLSHFKGKREKGTL